MTRWKITIEYDGKPYVGWQAQQGLISVQGQIEAALLPIAGKEVFVQGSGRTDAGVHALGQVAHFDLERPFDANKIRDAINAQLGPEPISILEAEAVDDAFHARFSATGRAYLYRIINRRPPVALDKGRVWQVYSPLDLNLMQEAASYLLGQHDFTSFRAAACQATSPIKTLDRLDVLSVGDEIHLIAEAKSFLHHQIRNFVGMLCYIGRGKQKPTDIINILDARDRCAAAQTAPACGLYLTKIDY
jgi:tRNA pseudouridine38-40 synthase